MQNAVLICVLGLFLFIRTVLYQPVGDDAAVTANPNLGNTYKRYFKGQRLSWHNVRQAIGNFEVRWLSWYTLGFLKVYSIQHLFNIILHIANCVLVQQLFGLLPSLLFAVHPLVTASVCPISGRFTLLSTLFALLALVAASTASPLLFITMWLMSLASKEDTLLLPFLAGWLYGWPWIVSIVVIMPIMWYFLPYGRKRRAPIQNKLAYFRVMWLGTFQRIPQWLIGRGLMVSPRTDWLRIRSIPLIMVTLYIVLLTLPFGSGTWMMFFIFGPWMLYSMVQLPHPWMDGRAYFNVIGLALLITSALGNASMFVVLLYTVLTMERIGGYKTHLAYWTMAIRDGAQDAPTIFNFGAALLNAGFIAEGRKAIQYGLTKDPKSTHAQLAIGMMQAHPLPRP